MRILMSVHHEMDWKFSPSAVTFQLADALRSRGHTVDVLSYSSMGLLRGKSQVVTYPLYVASCIAGRREYDVLDLSSGDGWMLTLLPRSLYGNPLIVARSHGLEHIVHEMHVELHRLGIKKLSWKYPLYHGGLRLWQCRRCFASADVALLLNDAERRYAIEKLGVLDERAALVKNGIGEHFVKRALTLIASPQPERRPQNIAFIGRYTELKGSRYLASAMRAILAAHPASTLGLFGVMTESNAILEHYPAELHDRISVVPSFENAELVELLRPYDILAFPSLVEGFPLAPLEAMACGLVPIVASADGPVSYVKDGRNGIIVPLKDAGALQQAIDKLLVHPNRWRELRRCALETALDYSYVAVASELEALYISRHAAKKGANRTKRARLYEEFKSE